MKRKVTIVVTNEGAFNDLITRASEYIKNRHADSVEVEEQE